MSDDTRICLGAIAGAFGVHGELRLKSFTATPEDIAAYGPLETEDATRHFEITLTGQSAKGALIARRRWHCWPPHPLSSASNAA